MWYYTGKGDQGESSLFNGQRVSKGNLVFELIGTLDEATAFLGIAISLCKIKKLKSDLGEIQDHLSKLMGIISGVEKVELERYSFLTGATEWLEKKINDYGKSVKNPQSFTYAGQSSNGAAIDVSRTIIRRAERLAVRYFRVENDSEKGLFIYLNRLSSFLYILRLFSDLPIK